MNEWEWQLLEEHAPVETVRIAGIDIRKGDAVRLRPRAGGDIFDVALAGQIALVESIEQDYEGKLHLAVVLEDDPGKDLGLLRQPGHRFFFTADEVDPLQRAPKILIAGIGNIFLGDDGFGPEVIRHLPQFSESVTVRDFGIRGYDLSYALLDGYDAVILIDAAPRGELAGTVSLIELDLTEDSPAPAVLDAHAMNPVAVLNLARSMGPVSGRIFLIACEPECLGGEEGAMGLTAAVQAAVPPAAARAAQLVQTILQSGNPVDCFQSAKKEENQNDNQ